MSSALALRTGQVWWDERQLAALHQLGLGNAGDGDRLTFLHRCQATGLDPFAGQIFMVERKGRWTIQVGIDGLRLIAERTGKYGGRLGPWWCGTDGQWSDVWLGDGPPAAARVAVIHTDHSEPVVGIALWRESVQMNREGQPVALWASKPSLMLAKVAEAAALRAGFPQDMAAMYTDDEIPAAPTQARPIHVLQADPVTVEPVADPVPEVEQ